MGSERGEMTPPVFAKAPIPFPNKEMPLDHNKLKDVRNCLARVGLKELATQPNVVYPDAHASYVGVLEEIMTLCPPQHLTDDVAIRKRAILLVAMAQAKPE